MKVLITLTLLYFIIAVSACPSAESSSSVSTSSSIGSSIVVYTAGCTSTSNYLVYWRNTETNFLTTNMSMGYCMSVWVDNGIVYTAGRNSNQKTCYWADKQEVLLPDGWGYANVVQYHNGNVYTCGGDSNSQGCYWIGTNKYIVPDTGNLQGMFVENGIVYTCGKDSSNRTCFWIGTNKTLLPEGSQSATSIYVKNGMVYTTGRTTNNYNCYWMDTNLYILEGGPGGNTIDIEVDNNGVVYVCGYKSGPLPFASYWIGTNIYTPNINSGYFYNIAVFEDTIYLSGEDTNHNAYYLAGTNKVVLGYGKAFGLMVVRE